MDKPKIACIVGTRPDAIKMAPVILEMKACGLADVTTLATGQHREMLEQALNAFGLKADQNLDIMQHGQTLAQVTSRALEGLDEALSAGSFDYVIAQGDTTTTFCAALAAFYRRIPFGHVEAGLRTDTFDNPFPEEFNRRACRLVTDLHFPPTQLAADNLAREGVRAEEMMITGNTAIDAVQFTAKAAGVEWYPEHGGRVILLTTHRRENWGEPQAEIARAARELVDRFPDVVLVVPMHRNPDVRATLTGVLGGHERIRLIEPPDYAPFVKLLARSSLALTDSGGVQEEAPSFGIPVLVLRTTTERPEGLDAGVAKLVGTDREAILMEGTKLLADQEAYRAMVSIHSPYGDGKAAQRIRWAVLNRLGVESPKEAAWE